MDRGRRSPTTQCGSPPIKGHVPSSSLCICPGQLVGDYQETSTRPGVRMPNRSPHLFLRGRSRPLPSELAKKPSNTPQRTPHQQTAPRLWSRAECQFAPTHCLRLGKSGVVRTPRGPPPPRMSQEADRNKNPHAVQCKTKAGLAKKFPANRVSRTTTAGTGHPLVSRMENPVSRMSCHCFWGSGAFARLHLLHANWSASSTDLQHKAPDAINEKASQMSALGDGHLARITFTI